MNKEGFGVYGATNRSFGVTNMSSGDFRLTDSIDTTSGIHLHPHPGPLMDSGGAAADISIDGRMMCHPLFGCTASCHCVSYGCLADASTGHLTAVG